jgi:hypothetical protein
MLSDRAKEVLRQYVSYLAAVPPGNASVRAVTSVLEGWIEQGCPAKSIPERELYVVLDYAQAFDMAWELSSVAGESPAFASELMSTLRKLK